MKKGKNHFFSKSPRCPIFRFFCGDSGHNSLKFGTNANSSQFIFGFAPFKRGVHRVLEENPKKPKIIYLQEKKSLNYSSIILQLFWVDDLYRTMFPLTEGKICLLLWVLSGFFPWWSISRESRYEKGVGGLGDYHSTQKTSANHMCCWFHWFNAGKVKHSL